MVINLFLRKQIMYIANTCHYSIRDLQRLLFTKFILNALKIPLQLLISGQRYQLSKSSAEDNFCITKFKVIEYNNEFFYGKSAFKNQENAHAEIGNCL